ncbi:hypothetical protein ALC57_12032 [Trachymyrmex cornetzi]|uniref:Uncharacterized protein n=1 Tax=Trachymyrmex cornetzi TaxID=471704 RepID=A0A151J1H9_9HYME|nr:hypothetical protein ALC57_12032 [Trachymyrmex cornetzi]
MEGKKGSKKVGNWATFTPADPADLSKRRPLDSRQVKGPGGKMLVHVYSALLFWWIPEDPDPLKRRAGIDDLPSCEPKECVTLRETERRTVVTGRPTRCSITAAGRSVASAGSAGVASGALADLIELGHLDGLPDAFKIDAYNAGLIAGHAVLRRRGTVLLRRCSVARARSVSASTKSARLLGLSLERKLAVISKCLRSRDNNHVTLDSVNDASSREKEDPLTPAQFLAFLRVEADNTLEKSCDMSTGRNNLLAVFLGTDNMNDRSTDGFSRHRYRRLRGLSPIRASCPQFRLP